MGNQQLVRGQIGLLLALILLGVGGIIALTFLFEMQTEERMAYQFQESLRAEWLARMGMEEAIAKLKNDLNHYDDLREKYARFYPGEDSFSGEDVDLDGDGIPDSRWIEVREKNFEGRYAVLVVDEEGKINLNVSGEGENFPGGGIFNLKLSFLLLPSQKEALVNYRRSFRPFATLEEIKLVPGIGKETFEKTKDFLSVYSYDKNINREGDLRVNINSASAEEISQALRRSGLSPSLADQLGVNIVDYRDSDSRPTELRGKYGIEKTPYINEVMPFGTFSLRVMVSELAQGGARWLLEEIKEVLRKKLKEEVRGNTERVEGEIKNALESLKPQVKKILRKIFSPPKTFLPSLWAQGEKKREAKIKIEVEWVELFNPYNMVISLWGWKIIASGGKKKIGGWVGPRSYNIILNMVTTIKTLDEVSGEIIKDRIGKEILGNYKDTVTLKNKYGDVVERVDYINHNLPWMAHEKNDPRVRKFAGKVPGGSPGFRNWYWNPRAGEGKDKNDFSSFVVKDTNFVSIGEVGFIHRGSDFRTVKFQPQGDGGICDEITVADPPEKPVPGRINLNTAPPEVLLSLPGVDETVAKDILNYRETKGPFEEIGDVLECWTLLRPGYNGKDDDEDGYIDDEKEKEFLFYKFSNLISVRSYNFTIISLGQILKAGSPVAEKKILVVVDRGKNPLRIQYYRELYD